jgi:exonuclease III
VRLVNLYRPPYTKKARYTECAFLEEFEDYLKDLTVKPGFPIIAGDFNLHMEKPEEHYPKKLDQLLEEYDGGVPMA